MGAARVARHRAREPRQHIRFDRGEVDVPIRERRELDDFSLRETIFAAIWPWLAFNSAIYSTYMGGEVKQAERTQVAGIMGALAWAGAWTMATTWAMQHLFGNTFWANLGNADPTSFAVDHADVRRGLRLLGRELVIASILMFGLTLDLRLDRALHGARHPQHARLVARRARTAKLAEVNARWHSPVRGLLMVFGLGVMTSAFYAFGNSRS